ncbi:MAG: nucleoside triphosphate pyrophosphohydrolase [Halieaceae bacterium]
MSDEGYSLDDLLRVMQRLRDPVSGCPWDVQQTFSSIVPSTLEECYELADAIAHEDYPHIAEELGDVLFQVVFYAQMAAEKDLFSFQSVVDTLTEKLIRRHPHVFAKGQIEGVVDGAATIESVKQSWESIKQQERNSRQLSGALADVPVALPALPRAQKLQKRAAQVGFDWSDVQGAADKLAEELVELREALARENPDDSVEELGDVLFSCVNVARHLAVDAEATLRQSSSKFEQRFGRMEALARDEGQSLNELDEEQLDQLWNLAKRQL